MYIYIQDVSVQCYKPSKRGSVRHKNSKLCRNARSEMLFWRGRWRYAKVLSVLPGKCHFAQEHRVSRMAKYMNAELANMQLTCGAAHCSELAAHWLHAEQCPTRRAPSHNFFARLHRRLGKQVSFKELSQIDTINLHSGNQTECATSDTGDIKFEYAKSSARSQDIPSGPALKSLDENSNTIFDSC